MLDFLHQLVFNSLGGPEVTVAFFGQLLGMVGSLLGGGGGGDNSAAIAAQVQNQKLQSATDRLNQAVVANQRNGENRLNTILQKSQQEQQGMDNVINALRASFMRDLNL